MAQLQKNRSFDDLTREEIAFLESQTGFDTLKGYIKDYDRNLMAHYAKGRGFKVEPDENPGQIRAVLTDDTKMQVRAMDAVSMDKIGRTHRNGKSFYYQYANSDLGNSDIPLYVPREFVTKQLERVFTTLKPACMISVIITRLNI